MQADVHSCAIGTGHRLESSAYRATHLANPCVTSSYDAGSCTAVVATDVATFHYLSIPLDVQSKYRIANSISPPLRNCRRDKHAAATLF